MIEATLLLLLGIVVILVNIAGTAYFVAQEFAYMSVDRTRPVLHHARISIKPWRRREIGMAVRAAA